jgi:isocitrate dehydrogenase (NAD+)
MKQYTVASIPGDGIGPEVMTAVRHVLDAADANLHWVEYLAGQSALDQGLALMPEATLEAITEHKLALKGPCTTPVGGGFSSVNVQLRQQLKLYAAVRPVRSLEGVDTRYTDVDIVVVRENTEGLYSGIENEVTEGVVTSLKVVTGKASRRIARWAFQYVKERGLDRLTVFHKANIMKLTDGMFIRCAREIHEQSFPGIDYQELIIDAGCMKLVQDPSAFQVLLLENLYGDVVNDLCAGLVGGLGVVPGANIGEDIAVFEAVHGSAPDIAGKGIENPLALLMSSVMLLNHIARGEGDAGCDKIAERIKQAYNQALVDGAKTRDLGGSLGTQEFAAAVAERL